MKGKTLIKILLVVLFIAALGFLIGAGLGPAPGRPGPRIGAPGIGAPPVADYKKLPSFSEGRI